VFVVARIEEDGALAASPVVEVVVLSSSEHVVAIWHERLPVTLPEVRNLREGMGEGHEP